MTRIQWCDSTWNPIVGCTQVINGDPTSSGCLNCYAQRQAYRNQAMRLRGYQDVAKKTSKGNIVWTGQVNLVLEALAKPLQRQKPTTWFVNSMSDLWHNSVPFAWVDLIFGIISLCPQHTFQILTKRPERMLAWSEQTHRDDWANAVIHHAWQDVAHRVSSTSALNQAIRKPGFPLPNVLLGVSVETQAAANERIELLLQTPAALRFLSCEPLLEEVDLTTVRCLDEAMTQPGVKFYPAQPLGTFNALDAGISWIIAGGESGYNARRCSVDWIRALVRQCQVTGVPVFVKQLGTQWAKASGTMDTHSKGGDPSVWSEDLRVRQFPEFPDVSDRLSNATSNLQEIR